MTAVQDIARLIPMGHSLAVLGNTLPSKNKKKKSILGTGFQTIVGVSLLPTISQLANDPSITPVIGFILRSPVKKYCGSLSIILSIDNSIVSLNSDPINKKVNKLILLCMLLIPQ